MAALMMSRRFEYDFAKERVGMSGMKTKERTKAELGAHPDFGTKVETLSTHTIISVPRCYLGHYIYVRA